MLLSTPRAGDHAGYHIPPESVLGPLLLDADGNATCDWYILMAVPQQEQKLVDKLQALGVFDAWFPTEKVMRDTRKGPKQVERKVVPGYVFTAWDHWPRWHVLKDRLGDLLRGIVCVNTVDPVGNVDDTPWCVPEDQILQMQNVPGRIEELRLQAQEKLRAEILAGRPLVGMPAMILEGPLEGQTVWVEDVRGDTVYFQWSGAKGEAKVSTMQRIEA